MRCPYCGHDDTQVKDSRAAEDNAAIRRRRQCAACGARFTTFERAELRELVVVKSGGRREPFDRDKLYRSLSIALRKRPVEQDRLQQTVTSLVRQLEKSSDGEVESKQIGLLAMEALKVLDPVAYVRYASVYRDFRAVDDFHQFLGGMLPVGEDAAS